MKVCQLLVAAFILIFVNNHVTAQAADWAKITNEKRPYKVQTTGRQVKIQSNTNLKDVMLWTIDGNRIVEHKGINTNTCILDIPTSQKAFFLMVVLHDGKIYTQKIGLR